MNHLILTYCLIAFKDIPEVDRMDGDLVPPQPFQVDHIVIPTVDGENAPERLTTGTGLGRQHHHVGYLVANNGLSEADETGKQDFVSQGPVGHRSVVLVHHLDHTEVLEDVQTPINTTLHGPQSLLGAVDVENRASPHRVDLLSKLAAKGFASTGNNTGLDVQASQDLLGHQQSQHRWESPQHIGLQSIQPTYQLLDGSGSR